MTCLPKLRWEKPEQDMRALTSTSLCLLLPVPNLGTGPGQMVKERQRAAREARGGFDGTTKVTGVLQVK